MTHAHVHNLVIFLIVSFTVLPGGYFGVPTFHNKFPNAGFLLIGLLILFSFRSLHGARYIKSVFVYAMIIVFNSLVNANIMEMHNILEQLLQIFIFLTPLIFSHLYPGIARNKALVLDFIIAIPIPLIVLPTLIIQFGFNPFSINESIVTNYFITHSALNPMVQGLYSALGTTTTICPALSVISIYFIMKLYPRYPSSNQKHLVTYVFLLLLTVYTNLWLHQRIFVALLGILLVMIFCRSIISLRLLRWFPAVFIIGITIILVSFELDARTALWRESIQALNFEYFSIGGGIGVYRDLGLSYFHPHNILILFLFELGLIGFLAILCVIINYYRLLYGFCYQHSINKDICKMSGILYLSLPVTLSLNSNLLSHEYWSVALMLILPLKLVADSR